MGYISQTLLNIQWKLLDLISLANLITQAQDYIFCFKILKIIILFFQFIFNPNDEPLLKHLTDDNQRIEPEWYMPIIPMVLVNGAEGIGTGKSS